ncbi:hypothetical protein [Vulcanisaeta thermophila]|uniref:hypothetical protein n=1 Tax=Vulcanisaeta thermophila TaxID=867917 RepID=UPI000A7D7669|nr:hypothetical protein [Vulcanisaeta thermophila]
MRLLRLSYLSYWVSNRDKYVVIKDSEVQGVFDSFEEAYKYALERFGINGMFIIQRVTEEIEYISSTHVLGLDSVQVS